MENWQLERGRLGDPSSRFKDICEHDLKALAINTDTWKALACDRCALRQYAEKGLSSCEDTPAQHGEGGGGGVVLERARRKSQSQTDRPASTLLCTVR